MGWDTYREPLDGTIRYVDTGEEWDIVRLPSGAVSANRPCAACGRCATERPPGPEVIAIDPCLGLLLGVVSACCGHGRPGWAYVWFWGSPRQIVGQAALDAMGALRGRRVGP